MIYVLYITYAYNSYIIMYILLYNWKFSYTDLLFFVNQF